MPTGVVANGTAPEGSEEEDSNAILAARCGWDQASDGTSSQRSRRSEDKENPHWSPRWGRWGFTEAHPEARGAHVNDGYPSPLDSDFNSEYSRDNDYPSLVRCTGHQTFVTRVADEDDETIDMEDESEASTEKIDAPRSTCAVTATAPADFFEEYWQMQECAGERQFEDCDDWFCEDNDAYDADRDDHADDNDDEHDFCPGD
jgi:hypothetical protein